MSEFVSLASNYSSGRYAELLMETWVAVTKKVLDFNLDIQRELLQKLSQTGQPSQNNNPTNTAVFLDIKA